MEYFFIAGACAVVAYGFGYFLMRRVQALLLEYFVTLVASTIPMGIILSIARSERSQLEGEDLAKYIFLGLLPVCLVIGGSVWGISVANRLRTLDQMHRLALMILGWGFVLTLSTAGGLFPIFICSVDFDHSHRSIWMLAPFTLGISYAIMLAASRLEKRAAPFGPVQGSDQITRLPRT